VNRLADVGCDERTWHRLAPERANRYRRNRLGSSRSDSDTPRHFAQNDAIFLLTMANILGLSLHSRMALQRSMQEAVDAAVALATQKTLLREPEHDSKTISSSSSRY
jgi:hypothetical protein